MIITACITLCVALSPPFVSEHQWMLDISGRLHLEQESGVRTEQYEVDISGEWLRSARSGTTTLRQSLAWDFGIKKVPGIQMLWDKDEIKIIAGASTAIGRLLALDHEAFLESGLFANRVVRRSGIRQVDARGSPITLAMSSGIALEGAQGVSLKLGLGALRVVAVLEKSLYDTLKHDVLFGVHRSLPFVANYGIDARINWQEKIGKKWSWRHTTSVFSQIQPQSVIMLTMETRVTLAITKRWFLYIDHEIELIRADQLVAKGEQKARLAYRIR